MEQRKRKLGLGRRRLAFTLVELLVVITIIGMLMALLMPAISVAREAGRRTQCIDNQKQIATAMLGYESSKQRFPSWRNNVTGNSLPQTWLVMLLPNLERGDLLQAIQVGGNPGVSPPTLLPAVLKILTCPSDPPATTSGSGPAAYVANGLILRDGRLTATVPTTPLSPLSVDYISGADGTANTLLLGENTQAPPSFAANATPPAVAKAHYWYFNFDSSNPSNDGSPASTAIPSKTTPTYAPTLIRQTFGVKLLGASYPSLSPNYPTLSAVATALQNFTADYGTEVAKYNNNVMTANVNSAHGGGAVVAFCDGHVVFMKDDVGLTSATGSTTSQSVYQILVTPDGSKIGGEPPADEGQW